MMRDFHKKIGLAGLIISALTLSAQAQIRVDARIHSSSGSCVQCDLSNKSMNGVKLKDADFTGSNFNSSNLSGGEIDGSILAETHFRKALMYRIEGRHVNMSKAVLEDATLIEANLSDSIFTNADFRRADLTRAVFSGSDFTNSSLQRAIAVDVDFKNVNFTQAKLAHANFQNAALEGADLSGADLSQTQGLKQDQLDTACGNMETRLPFGLTVPYCEGILFTESKHAHDNLDPKMARAAQSLERAMRDVEIILESTPATNRPMRRKLQSIHADIANSKRFIEP